MDRFNAVISHITLGVSDIEKMQNFYSGLGFEVCKVGNEVEHPFTMFKSGSLILALYPKHLLAKQAACEIADIDSNNAMALSLNVHDKQAVDSLINKAESLKADITRKGFEPEWGGYCAYFKDPEANLWEIVWHDKFMFPS